MRIATACAPARRSVRALSTYATANSLLGTVDKSCGFIGGEAAPNRAAGGGGGWHLAGFSFPLPLMVVQPVTMPLAVQLYVLSLRHAAPSLASCCVCFQRLASCKVRVGTLVRLVEAAELHDVFATNANVAFKTNVVALHFGALSCPSTHPIPVLPNSEIRPGLYATAIAQTSCSAVHGPFAVASCGLHSYENNVRKVEGESRSSERLRCRLRPAGEGTTITTSDNAETRHCCDKRQDAA